jgi:copper chaperone CopZ
LVSHQSTWTVRGMTCGHCVASVTEELEAVPGVLDADVTLETGRVVVSSHEPLAGDAVAAAVEEAGYELVT